MALARRVVPVGRSRRQRGDRGDARRARGVLRWRRPVGRLLAAQRRPPDRARRRPGRDRLGARAHGRGPRARRAARAALHAARGRGPDAAGPRLAGWRGVGARGPAQAVGDRPLHVRQRRARGRPRVATAGADPFALETLGPAGRARQPPPGPGRPRAFRPGDPAFDALPRRSSARRSRTRPAARSSASSASIVPHRRQGTSASASSCSGRSVAALEAVLPQTAKPLGRGRAAAAPGGTRGCASRPGWAGACRRSPAPTPSSTRSPCTSPGWVATPPRASSRRRPALPEAQRAFDEHCAACHGPDGAWPIRARLKRTLARPSSTS